MTRGSGKRHARTTIGGGRNPVKRRGTANWRGKLQLGFASGSGFCCKFLGERVVRAFGVPEDADDPPTLAVVEELEAVDAARERRFAGDVAGLVATEDLGDVPERFNTIDDRILEEAVL